MLTPELKKLKSSLEGGTDEVDKEKLLQELSALEASVEGAITKEVENYMFYDLDISHLSLKPTRDFNPPPSDYICPTCGRPFRKGGVL